MKIGLLKEGKIPIDRRVPLAPNQARELQSRFPGIQVIAQASDIRCFQDDEFSNDGIEVHENVNQCDILLGVKEVPINNLIPNKTYIFFSHTIKKQAYNRRLLQEIIKKNIRLIDYEVLTDPSGERLIAFGRYAGIVGAYNGIMAVGLRNDLFTLRRAHECFDLEDLQSEFDKVTLPPLKILVTGGGRVSKGAIEVLHGMGIKKVSPADAINKSFDEPVFSQLRSRDYHLHKLGKEFSRVEFHNNPVHFYSDFQKYCDCCDVLIAAAYWDPRAPRLFSREDMLKENFNISVIADITCDINGSIPSTKKATSIDEPFYDYNPANDSMEPPFKDKKNVSVMSIDNLPAELPRDASQDFGTDLLEKILPALLGDDQNKIIKRATITQDGKLTERYRYLEDFVALKA